MNFIKRAFWSVKARMGKSILLLIVLTVISVLVLSGLTIQTAADQSSILAREKLGGEVTLTVDREKLMEQQQGQDQDGGGRQRFQSVPVPLESAEELIDSTYVKGYNYYSSTSALAKDFTAVGSEEATETSDQGGPGGGRMMAGDVSVEGIVFSDSTSSFMNGDASIVEGRHLTEEDLNKDVTLIEKNLASENDLKVGDSITLANTDGTESTLEIVGVYETTAEMDERAQNFTFLNPYNQLFVPYTVANTLKGTGDAIDRAVYYMMDPADIQSFIADAEKSSIDFDQYKLDANDQLYQQMMGPIENVASFSNNVVLLVTIAGAIILALIVMMTIRERKYEMGVLLAIGEKKAKLVSQFLVEILIVAVLAMGISTMTGNLVANQIGEKLLQQEITQSEEATDTPASFNSRRMPFQASNVQDVDAVNELSIHTTGEDLIKLFGIGMMVVLLSTMIPSLTVLRLNPKAILTKQD
ncbi:ABC transporter permease [Rossellomorea sp. DA94]|uniref:ABC transporter permease n=1 Tax=Rossellomorea sp. DA94 TaxID=3038653 RepID=UPI002449BEB6|nr:ABC transporter permease [Rossellomorea sp. DA94]WGG47030.1 ABC transporter permease [Rossellomorea sp. DA94]